MKRKHGKKSKSKKHLKLSTNEPVETGEPVETNEPVEKVSSDNTEDNSGAAESDNEEGGSGKEVETTIVVEKEPPEKTEDTNSSVVVNRPVGNLVYGRMKVKFKSSKVVEPQVTATDATPTRSDTDMSSQQVGPEKIDTPSEKVEESESSLPDVNIPVSANPSKKAGSIKIKTSRNIGPSLVNPGTSVLNGNSGTSLLNPCTSTSAQNEEMHLKEPGVVGDHRSNDLELKAALEIIKKIMKMDAAEPFNVPVNPVALGIPDYFDVISYPMDFGTICSNLESGDKYKKAEEVYKDVEYVWNNCYTYNNRGDYVVELMKRVKKNFTKYWMAAGLYGEQPQGSSGADVSQSIDAPPSGDINAQGEGSQVIPKKRPGVKKHKEECMCAICKMMRRREERERSFRNEYRSLMVQEGKQEGQSPAESPYQDTSSNMGNSSGADSDLERIEEQKLKYAEGQYARNQERMENRDFDLGKQARSIEILGSSQIGERSAEKSGEFSAHGNDVMLIDSPREQFKTRHEDRIAAVEQNKRKVLLDKIERAKILEKLQRFENPQVLKLCENLFNSDVKSVWSGSHSLVSHQGRSGSSSIHEAISSFMN